MQLSAGDRHSHALVCCLFPSRDRLSIIHQKSCPSRRLLIIAQKNIYPQTNHRTKTKIIHPVSRNPSSLPCPGHDRTAPAKVEANDQKKTGAHDEGNQRAAARKRGMRKDPKFMLGLAIWYPEIRFLSSFLFSPSILFLAAAHRAALLGLF